MGGESTVWSQEDAIRRNDEVLWHNNLLVAEVLPCVHGASVFNGAEVCSMSSPGSSPLEGVGSNYG